MKDVLEVLQDIEEAETPTKFQIQWMIGVIKRQQSEIKQLKQQYIQAGNKIRRQRKELDKYENR